MEIPLPQARPHPLGALFVDWLLVGLQSFGGGSSTFMLIHQLCMKRGWLSEEEFVRTWALVQIAPGINLVKFTMIIGYRLRGWPGLLASASGMLLPSAFATAAMTAGFATIRNVQWIQAMMKGLLPAAIGLSFAMAVRMAKPLLSRARQEGSARLAAHLFVVFSAAVLLGFAKLSPLAILLFCGAAAMALFAVIPAGEKRR